MIGQAPHPGAPVSATLSKPARIATTLTLHRYRPDWSVLGMVLTIKVLLLLFAVVAYESLTTARVDFPRDWLEIWNRWDAQHYISIAERGYSARGSDRVLLVFFPFYPWLIRAVSPLTGDTIIAALLISTVASFAAAELLLRLTHLDYPAEVARRAVWFLFIFPTSYFLHIGYTESLCLALVLGAFLAARTRHWALAGVLGLLAGGTRVNGVLLVPALAMEAYLQYRETRRLQLEWLWVAAPLAGFGIYLWVNYQTVGDPFHFLELQKEHWTRSGLAWPWAGLRNSLAFMESADRSRAQMVGGQELFFSLLGLAGAVASWLLLRPSYAVWMSANWLLFTANEFVASVPRYTLLLFPLFILFARLAARPAWNTAITVWSLLFLALFTAQFVRWQWAF
jgi:hypothetical protein